MSSAKRRRVKAGTPPAASAPAPGRRRLLAGLALLGTVLVTACVGLFLWRRATKVELPRIDPAGIDAAVFNIVAEARARVSQQPDSAGLWGQYGMVLMAHDFRAAAQSCFTEAERLDPREPRWPYYHGVLIVRKDPTTAVAKLRRAADLCGDDPPAPRLRLAEALLEQGRALEAEQLFRGLLQRHPENPTMQLDLGRLAHGRGAWRESLPHLNRAASDARTRKTALLLLAEVHQRLGDGAAAEQAAQQAAELPDDPPWTDPFRTQIAQLQTGKKRALIRADQLLGEDRAAEAIQLLRQTAQDYPDSEWVWFKLGKTLLQEEELTGAEQALRKGLELAPRSAELQFHLGAALSLQTRHAEAAACYRQATELKPDFALAHHNLGNCLIELGDQPAAIVALRDALRCEPNLVESHVDLGEQLAQAGQTAESLTHLRQALQLDPAHARAQRLLEQIQR